MRKSSQSLLAVICFLLLCCPWLALLMLLPMLLLLYSEVAYVVSLAEERLQLYSFSQLRSVRSR